MVKLRFAPSPTGHLHVGNFRTALINFLFAKKNLGHFLLRIDDTDVERSKLIFEQSIKEDLNWSGINWDSEKKQSLRLDRYQEILDYLIQKESIYPCFETPDQLLLKRKSLLSSGKPPIYDRSSLNLSKTEIRKKIDEGLKPHYRFKLKLENVIWKDIIRGKITYNMSNVSDPIVVREDGRFIYTLASVIDKMVFGITPIIRGAEKITNSAAHNTRYLNV
jgi:Glutamyl- and glutaminyl-tRNA synthetases